MLNSAVIEIFFDREVANFRIQRYAFDRRSKHRLGWGAPLTISVNEMAADGYTLVVQDLEQFAERDASEAAHCLRITAAEQRKLQSEFDSVTVRKDGENQLTIISMRPLQGGKINVKGAEIQLRLPSTPSEFFAALSAGLAAAGEGLLSNT